MPSIIYFQSCNYFRCSYLPVQKAKTIQKDQKTAKKLRKKQTVNKQKTNNKLAISNQKIRENFFANNKSKLSQKYKTHKRKPNNNKKKRNNHAINKLFEIVIIIIIIMTIMNLCFGRKFVTSLVLFLSACGP